MPNGMAAMSNICGTLCSMPQSLADVVTSTTRLPCSNAAKMQNPLKFAGVPQTRQQISAASRPSAPYCEDMWERHCYFLLIVATCLSCEDIDRQSCAMVSRWHQMANFWRFLGPVFPASRVQHISDLHSKFALGPHHV